MSNKIAKKLLGHMDSLIEKRVLFSKDEDDAFKFFASNKLLKKKAVAS